MKHVHLRLVIVVFLGIFHFACVFGVSIRTNNGYEASLRMVWSTSSRDYDMITVPHVDVGAIFYHRYIVSEKGLFFLVCLNNFKNNFKIIFLKIVENC